MIRFPRTTAALILALVVIAGAHAQKWTLTVVADPLQDRGLNGALAVARDKATSPIKYVLVAGDYNPLSYNIDVYNKAFPTNRPELLLVQGNHEAGSADRKPMFDQALQITRAVRNIKVRGNTLNYFVDNGNVRIIAVSQYSDWGNDLGYSSGCINAKGLAWVDSVIKVSTGIDHIFVSFHEPAFAYANHGGNSFDACKADRDAFWNMLVSHRKKVRAVFVGHTHAYWRIRVGDPTKANATANHTDGIYQIDLGQVKHAMNIEINGGNLDFKVWSNGGSATDQWQIAGNTRVTPVLSSPRQTLSAQPVDNAYTIQGALVGERIKRAAGLTVEKGTQKTPTRLNVGR